jgi:formylglycine-generating enzyme required for sulfatase activity
MPVHWVEFRHGFWIARTEITNAQYERFDRDHLRTPYSSGLDTPVVDVSWYDAKAYCEWLSKISGRAIRLPSEAEWECACRAGNDGAFSSGDRAEDLSKYAWFALEPESGARAVATNRPNRWGLSDLHGNVLEWCEDTWHESYEKAPTDGSPWVDVKGPGTILRGGAWNSSAGDCRSAIRTGRYEKLGSPYVGFRPAFVNSGR